MKKLLVIILVFVIIGGVGIISYKNFSKKSNNINSPTLVYNGESGKWENVQNIPRINREELDKSPNEDGFNNMSLLRGYFDHYDEKSGDIVIKSLLPFTMGSQFEIVNLRVPVSKVVYCAPKITIVPNTGKEIPTQTLTFPVKDGQILNITGEKLINFGKFIQEAKADTYVFVQLTQDFDKKNTSYIKKLIVIGLCD